jgi:ATP-dependent helicase HrpA
VHGHAGAATDSHRLSNRQQEQRLREQFVSPRRVREWRDIHSQLHTVVAEHGWRLNGTAATYEQMHLSMLAGLLGNVGCKSDDEEWYLGARGIKFWRHPGAHLSKKPARWLIAAELVETTRLYGRGLAAIEPQWIPGVAGHLLKKQLLAPHWERKAAEVVALERATLYGVVVYNNRRVNYAQVDPTGAREIFIREALVNGDWDSKLPFLAHNRKLIGQVEELEHKSRRQDVLVDDELIYAFYDQQLPADVCSGASLERWFRDEVKRQPRLLQLTRDELMRRLKQGIAPGFPKTLRLGGIDCAAEYLHEPGNPKDGVTVTVPIYALNQVSDERCDWLVPGMLRDKAQALLKSLPQRPRSRLVPLLETTAEFCELAAFAHGELLEVLLKFVRERTQLAVQRNDFKLDTVPVHLFMNLRVVDEHGRQLAWPPPGLAEVALGHAGALVRSGLATGDGRITARSGDAPRCRASGAGAGGAVPRPATSVTALPTVGPFCSPRFQWRCARVAGDVDFRP